MILKIMGYIYEVDCAEKSINIDKFNKEYEKFWNFQKNFVTKHISIINDDPYKEKIIGKYGYYCGYLNNTNKYDGFGEINFDGSHCKLINDNGDEKIIMHYRGTFDNGNICGYGAIKTITGEFLQTNFVTITTNVDCLNEESKIKIKK